MIDPFYESIGIIAAILTTSAFIPQVYKIYKEKIAIVPYVMPGFELAKLCHMIISKNHKVEGLMLLNHGIFTFGNSAKQSYDRMINLVTLAENFLNKQN